MDQQDDMRRRDFLAKLGGAGTIATLGIASHAGLGVAQAAGRTLSLGSATSRSFHPLVGQQFRLATPGGPARAVQLVDVVDSPRTPGRDDAGMPFRRSFSLMFHDPEGPMLPQGTYRVQHPMLGIVGLFIVPIGPHEQDVVYEAVLG